MKTWSFKKHFLSCLILFSFLYILGRNLLPDKQYAFSVGVIGGADGPTTVFITEKLLNYYLLESGIIFFFIIALILYSPIRKLIK